jgi:Tol biopolymer transport system component
MDRRGFLVGISAALALAQGKLQAAAPAGRKKGVMLMNRIGPSASDLYVANADGTGERKLLQQAGFDYHATFSADGRWVVFTSERNGLGQSDLFRARADGSDIQPLAGSPAVEDAGALSPDGQRVAFVSTRQGYRANIWVLDLQSGQLRNLTGADNVQGDPSGPDSYFRPAWSPDGQWLAFSSDRLTDWRGHDGGHGWEHTQELSIYVIRADGQGFRRVASKPGFCLGSPKWSPNGRRVIYYEISTEQTWGARRPELIASVESQIGSVDVATGEPLVHTAGPGLKVFPQFLTLSEIAYHRKGGADEGIVYTSERAGFKRVLRSPNWSPDGRQVVYEKVTFRGWRENQPLYSWDADWDYRYTDVFPVLARDGTLAFTEKAANSSIVTLSPDGSNRRRVYDVDKSDLDPSLVKKGLAGAFMPAWSPDSQWIAFGLGEWFQMRRTGKAKIMRIRRDGTGLEALTDGTIHSGFPSYSADGNEIVFRVFGADVAGLRILNIKTRQTRVLTTEYDNLPAWSPDGTRIVFTRRVDAVNFDIYTIRPDGSDLQRLTTSRANDGHAVWTADGRIMWSSGMYGFREEAALYDNTFQPYGQIFIMNSDGTGRRMLTDSIWEDSMPLYLTPP